MGRHSDDWLSCQLQVCVWAVASFMIPSADSRLPADSSHALAFCVGQISQNESWHHLSVLNVPRIPLASHLLSTGLRKRLHFWNFDDVKPEATDNR